MLGLAHINLEQYRKGTLRQFINVEGGTLFFQSASAPDGPFFCITQALAPPSGTLVRVSPFEWAAGGSSTKREGVRKVRRPNGATNDAPS